MTQQTQIRLEKLKKKAAPILSWICRFLAVIGVFLLGAVAIMLGKKMLVAPNKSEKLEISLENPREKEDKATADNIDSAVSDLESE